MKSDIEKILQVLNEAYLADPQAIHALVCNRVPCNEKLANHPTIQVQINPVFNEEVYIVGLLGIINGITEILTGERVAASWDANGKFSGFVKYIKP